MLDCLWPLGFGKRVDTGFGKGDIISSNYDSLITKIITWDTSRIRAIEKMRCALEETVIFGCLVNIPFLKHLLCMEEFLENKITTDFVEKNFPKGLKSEPFPFDEEFLIKIYKEEKEKSPYRFSKEEPFNPWSAFLKRKK